MLQAKKNTTCHRNTLSRWSVGPHACAARGPAGLAASRSKSLAETPVQAESPALSESQVGTVGINGGDGEIDKNSSCCRCSIG